MRASQARGRIMLRRSGGTADADDSKSSDRKVVRVRIPPSAPRLRNSPCSRDYTDGPRGECAIRVPSFHFAVLLIWPTGRQHLLAMSSSLRGGLVRDIPPMTVRLPVVPYVWTLFLFDMGRNRRLMTRLLWNRRTEPRHESAAVGTLMWCGVHQRALVNKMARSQMISNSDGPTWVLTSM